MKKHSKKIPIVAFVGKSNSGKTTLLKKLIRILTDRGYRVGAIKHTHHRFEMDKRGKDSYELKASGAEAVCIFSPTQLGLVRDLATEPSLAAVAQSYFSEVDLILSEGFKHYSVPHIIVARGRDPLVRVSKPIAIVSEKKRAIYRKARHFIPSDVIAIADFLEEQFLA